MSSSIMEKVLVQKSSSSSTKVKTVKLAHTWVIDSFLDYFNSAGFANINDNSCKVIESARFANEHVELYLKCYPFFYTHYEDNEYERINIEDMHLAVALCLVKSNLGKTPISFEISCLDTNGAKTKTLIGKFPGSKQCTKGLETYITKSDFNRLLVDNNLSINCEITYITTAISAPFENNAPENIHFEKMAANFVRLRKDENFTDIVLVVGGTEFHAHKFWLCAQSPVFEAMFLKHDTKEKQENRVEITDVDSVVFGKLLDFIYSGKSDCVRGREDELLAAADKYGLEHLNDACADELCKKLTPATVTDLLVLADTYNSSKLKQKALEYLKVHGQDTIDAMFANNQTDNLVSAIRRAMPGNSSSPGNPNPNQYDISNRGGNYRGRNYNRNWRSRGGRGNQSNQFHN